jgi:hypothetical protein
MPPAESHHFWKAVAVSKSSWSRPGWKVLPGSAMVDTSISVLVTPRAVAPLALPGPHTPFRVPKLPPDVVVAAAVVGVDVPWLLLPLRLQPAATSARARASPIARLPNRFTTPPVS